MTASGPSTALSLALSLGQMLLDTAGNVLPIIGVLVGFQVLVLRRPIPQVGRVVFGFVLVVVGLAFFMEGLERALFPLGDIMVSQLTAPAFLGLAPTDTAALQDWRSYGWVYCFAFAIGFTTTVAEPALIAIALKANQVAGGSIGTWGLRITVAIGVALGVSLGAFRIITGTPLHYYIIPGYLLVLIQTWFAPRAIVALAYDSGGVTTSTVTVPLVTALGLGLSSQIPGRNPVFDGFGLIAFASLFPIMTVMGYAQLTEWYTRRARA